MTRAQNIDALAGAIRGLIQVLIAADQGRIGHQEDATRARVGRCAEERFGDEGIGARDQ